MHMYHYVWRALVACTVFWLLPDAPSAAAVVSFSGTIPSCQTAGGTATDCATTVYYSTVAASATTNFISGNIAGQDPGLADFATAFNNWNATNGDLWTLVDGGILGLGLSLSVNGALATNGGGINSIIVTLNGYQPTGAEPSLNQLVWTQALFTDYTPTAGLVSIPTVTLDTYSLSATSTGSSGAFENPCVAVPGQSPGANNTTQAVIGPVPSGSTYCDPIYPFQYGSEFAGGTLDGVLLGTDFFFDGPEGPWPDAAFRGIALLSTVTFDTDATGAITNRVLTVYQGVDYGFSLSVPEAGSLLILGTALPMLAMLRRTTRRRIRVT